MAKHREPLKLIPLDQLKKLGEALAHVPKDALDKPSLFSSDPASSKRAPRSTKKP